MSEMLERVQLALLEVLRPVVMYLPESPESVLLDGYVDVTALARAAVEALREPSEGMLDAGWAEAGMENAAGVWRDMLDHILKEG